MQQNTVIEMLFKVCHLQCADTVLKITNFASITQKARGFIPGHTNRTQSILNEILGIDVLTSEPLHQKTNNLYKQKQRRRSVVQ